MSPINGLTNGTPSFREIGRLRKGAPKTAEKLTDLKYFRPDFRPSETAAFRRFLEVYGDKPTKIEARLAFDQIDLCWDANWEVYNTRGLLGMADGVKWIYLRSNTNGDMLVRDGEVIKVSANMQTATDDAGRMILPFDAKEVVYSYKNNKNQDVAVYPRPTGKLKLILPKLGMLNYVTLLTHSWYDVANISNELAAVASVAASVGLTTSQIPLVVTRSMDKVSVTINGQKSLSEKSLVHVDIDPVFAELYMSVIARNQWAAIVPGETRDVAQLPAPPAGAQAEADEESEASSETAQANIANTANVAAENAASGDNTPPQPEEPPFFPADAQNQSAAGVQIAENHPNDTKKASIIAENDNKSQPDTSAGKSEQKTTQANVSDVETHEALKDIGSEFNLLGQGLWPGKWSNGHKAKIVAHHTADGQFNLPLAVAYLKDRQAALTDDNKLKEHVIKSWPWATAKLLDALLAQLADHAYNRQDLVHGIANAGLVRQDLSAVKIDADYDLLGQVCAIILSDMPPF